MRTNHADGSRQAETVINRRPRVLKAHIFAVLLTPLLANSASAESDKTRLSHSPLAVPLSTRAASPRTVPAAGQTLHELGEGSYPRTHYQKALYLRQKGELDAALIEFLKATQIDPHLVRAFYEQALIFRERHYLKLAESALEQALAIKPDYQPARILLATVRLEQGNLTGAVSELSRSLGLPQTKPGQMPANSQERGHFLPLPGEPAPTHRAPSLMQTPHTMLPEPPAPPAVTAPAPSFDPAPAQFQEVPEETGDAWRRRRGKEPPEPYEDVESQRGEGGAMRPPEHASNAEERGSGASATAGGEARGRSRRLYTTKAGNERRTGFAHEPFQLEGSPIGPSAGTGRSATETGSTTGMNSASASSSPTPGFSQRTSFRHHGSPAPANKLPFGENLPKVDFKFPNPFGFFKKTFFQDGHPRQERTSKPTPQSNVPDLSPQPPQEAKPAPAVQTAPTSRPPLPVRQQQPPPTVLQSIQPERQLPAQPVSSPQSPPPYPAPPAVAGQQAPAPPPRQASAAPQPVKDRSQADVDAKKSTPNWWDKVLAGVRELSAATLAPREASKPRPDKRETPAPSKPSTVAQDADSIPMVVFAGKPNYNQTREPERSFDPIAMVIRQPPAAFVQARKERTGAGEPPSNFPPQPVPVAMARPCLPLPGPRGPAEHLIGQTLPTRTPVGCAATALTMGEPAPLPDRPVVALVPPPAVSLSPPARQQTAPSAPALPATRNQSPQPAALPATMPHHPDNSAPVPRAPSPANILNRLLPSWISPAPLTFGGGDTAPAPRLVNRQQPNQPVVQPNRIEQPRMPFVPVRAVGKPQDVNPLALLFGSEPGPKPTPPKRVESRQAPQPSAGNPLPQVVMPPVINKPAEVEELAPPPPGEPPRLLQHPARPSPLTQRTSPADPLPGAAQPLIQPVQPSSMVRVTASTPQPPGMPLRRQMQSAVAQTLTVPAELALAGDQPAPSPRQLQQQRETSYASVKPARIDTPRSTLVQISAVGRPPAPVQNNGASAGTRLIEPRTTAQKNGASPGVTLSELSITVPQVPSASPAAAVRSAPQTVQNQTPLPVPRQMQIQDRSVPGQLPATQQVTTQTTSAPSPPGTPLASTLGYSNLPGSQSRLLAMAGTRLPAAYLSQRTPAQQAAPTPPPPPRVEPLDPVAKRMKYLAEHGTASLKEGEAFMFSEETGEAVLFQSNGQTLRRKIAEPQDAEQVVRNRRPDLAFPQELKYNLSLLAKLLPHQEEPKPQTPPAAPATFSLNEVLAKPEGVFGWLRQLFRM